MPRAFLIRSGGTRSRLQPEPVRSDDRKADEQPRDNDKE